MNQEIKKKWLEALSKSRKARGQLRKTKSGAMCCMGVLCDLYAKETGVGGWKPGGTFLVKTKDSATIAPSAVLRWASITFEQHRQLVRLNDTQSGYPIKAIEEL